MGNARHYCHSIGDFDDQLPRRGVSNTMFHKHCLGLSALPEYSQLLVAFVPGSSFIFQLVGQGERGLLGILRPQNAEVTTINPRGN